MSKSIIGEQLWAEMTRVQKAEAISRGRATLKQPAEGLLDGSDELSNSCQEPLTYIDASVAGISLDTDGRKNPSQTTNPRVDKVVGKRLAPKRKKKVTNPGKPKSRFGLPQGFNLSLRRYGRSVLLEDDIYRLPSGQEFIPRNPTGSLGKPRHLYALLTLEQVEVGRRGSVYIHSDGRIFDYGVDHRDPSRDLFDTGYTINDLERTGRYAPTAGSKKAQTDERKPRRLAHGG